MKMKPGYILAFAVIVLLALIYIGCEQPPEPVSQEDRADRFETDLNNDAERDNIWENLHPSIQGPYKAPATWDAKFAYSYKPFSFNNLAFANDTATGTMTYNPAGELTENIVIEFDQDGEDWYISKVTVGVLQIIP